MPCCVQVICEDGRAVRKHSTEQAFPKSIPHYTLHVHAPVKLFNLLPYDVHCSVQVLAAAVIAAILFLLLQCICFKGRFWRRWRQIYEFNLE